MVLMGYSGARGTLIYEKNLMSKISCQTPWNILLCTLDTELFANMYPESVCLFRQETDIRNIKYKNIFTVNTVNIAIQRINRTNIFRSNKYISKNTILHALLSDLWRGVNPSLSAPAALAPHLQEGLGTLHMPLSDLWRGVNPSLSAPAALAPPCRRV